MGHQSYVLLCTETALSNPPAVIPKSSCDVLLLRSPWLVASRHLSIGARIDLLFEIYALFFFHKVDIMHLFVRHPVSLDTA